MTQKLTEAVSRRKSLALAIATALGFIAGPALLTPTDAMAQTQGMERRDERRQDRQDRRTERRTKKKKKK